jgi:hypothetical protein
MLAGAFGVDGVDEREERTGVGLRVVVSVNDSKISRFALGVWDVQ